MGIALLEHCVSGNKERIQIEVGSWPDVTKLGGSINSSPGFAGGACCSGSELG